jgi:hypothetical protein
MILPAPRARELGLFICVDGSSVDDCVVEVDSTCS